MRPSFTPENHRQEQRSQVPLFLEKKKKSVQDLTSKNKEDLDLFLSQKIPKETESTYILSGADYLRLYSFASLHAISLEVLQHYLSEKKIVVTSETEEQKAWKRFH